MQRPRDRQAAGTGHGRGPPRGDSEASVAAGVLGDARSAQGRQAIAHGRGPDPLGHFRRSGDFTPYTAISNVTGSPAISLPLFARREDDPDAGLPLGVQLIGQPLGEGALLALSTQLEEAAPWVARRAPVS